MSKNSELIDALNMICEHVENNMPEGYDLSIFMNSDESYVELIGPDSEVLEIETDTLISVISSAIDTAITHDAINAGETSLDPRIDSPKL